MPRASRANPTTLSESRPDNEQARPLAINTHECHLILLVWAESELNEYAKNWYPTQSAGFSDIRSGYRELIDASEIDWHVQRAGWVVSRLPVEARGTIKRLYLSTPTGVTSKQRREALRAFGREWAVWLGVDDPVNSL